MESASSIREWAATHRLLHVDAGDSAGEVLLLLGTVADYDHLAEELTVRQELDREAGASVELDLLRDVADEGDA